MGNNHYQHIFVIHKTILNNWHKTILNNWWYVEIQWVKKLLSPIDVLPLAGPAEQHLEAQHCPQWNCASAVSAWRLGVSSHQWSILVGVFRSILGFQDVLGSIQDHPRVLEDLDGIYAHFWWIRWYLRVLAQAPSLAGTMPKQSLLHELVLHPEYPDNQFGAEN